MLARTGIEYFVHFLFQEEMHEQMSGYKRLRRDHQAALAKLEEACRWLIVREMCYVLNMREIEAWYLIFGYRQEMEKHKQLLDKEYEQLLTQFSKVKIVDFNQQLEYFSQW